MKDKTLSSNSLFASGEEPFGQRAKTWFPMTSVRLRVTVGFLAKSAILHAHAPGFSHLKLQKLLYYMQGFCVAKTGNPLFSENIEAWQLGPVVREVWYECKEHGSGDLPVQDLSEVFSRGVLDDYQIEIMKWVYAIRGHLAAQELVDKTHEELPWKKQWERSHGGIISLPTMARYFFKVQA